MSTRISIIPGFTHKISDKCYRWLIEEFEAKGFEVQKIKIDWKRKVMSNYVEQFKTQYQNGMADNNFVLGFSFGAMIALISAGELEPDKLLLCSLSPCFKEDLEKMSKNDGKVIGTRRIQDFHKYSAIECAKRTSSPTIIFCGGKEAQRYPALLKRCRQAARLIGDSKLVIVPEAPHDISFPSYIEAIKSNFY